MSAHALFFAIGIRRGGVVLFAKVIVDIAHADVDRLFTYHVPEDMSLQLGQRVVVPFGAGNKPTEGFVLALLDEIEPVKYQIKAILRTLEPFSVLSKEQIALAYWIQESYRCVLVDALRLMIPAELRGGRVKEKTIRTVMLHPQLDQEKTLESLQTKNGVCKAPRQNEVLSLMLQCGKPMSTADICGFIPGAASAIAALCKKNIIVSQDFVTFRDPFADMQTEPSLPQHLLPAQQTAYNSIAAALDKRAGTLLLHGVTGSGKTEVYLQAIAKVIKEGGKAIVLVPEISLTPQTMSRFKSRFGDRVAILHSHLSAGERYDEWRRIRLGRADIVIGARSAVFAPVENLRMIVIDEEHEPSYASEITPRYNAIETAAKRCELNGAVLLLGSATPSLLSYYRATHNRYTLLSMPRRVNDIPMPKVQIVDMRSEFMNGNTSIFSAALHLRLAECLKAGEQAILFMNRRGYSTFVSCRGCGYVFKCENCDVSMTYHKTEHILKCHYCGHTMRFPKVCPSCGKPYIKCFGVGTQQVEEALHQAFPGVASLRMDIDTTHGKNAHYEILQRFSSGQAQVLIGTQMVAKGLDIPNVTLVGVIAADATLHIPDYRSAERTFQLTTQVAGRAGRDANKAGHVVIQTYSPAHPAITLAAAHDYPSFYAMEIEQRRKAAFPPFSLFVRILFTGEEESVLYTASERCAKGLHAAITETLVDVGGDPRELLMLYASAAPIVRKQGAYRYQVLLKLARTKATKSVLHTIYQYCDEHRNEHQSMPEINPQSLF